MGQPAVGDISRRTATIIRALRTQRGITHVELARRLAEAGRPIPVIGLSRIENHKRRLDVDDVAAIAAALGVDPGQLVFRPDWATALRDDHADQVDRPRTIADGKPFRWNPAENCYCGGPEEIGPHRHGTGRHCRSKAATR